jgi:hypothetical protein
MPKGAFERMRDFLLPRITAGRICCCLMAQCWNTCVFSFTPGHFTLDERTPGTQG